MGQARTQNIWETTYIYYLYDTYLYLITYLLQLPIYG